MKKYCPGIFLLLLSFISFSQTPQLDLVQFSTGYSGPVDIKNCGDSRLFIVQQGGYIYTCDSNGVKHSTAFLDVHTKIVISSEQGLLGLAFDPDYLTNRTFYIYYCKKGGSNNLTVLRYKTDSLDPEKADTNTAQVLLSIPHPSFYNHDGGCMQFGPDGYLYIGTGDGGSGGDPPNNSQNHLKYLGKMLRIDVHQDSLYAVPSDNPFVDDATFYPEIYAYGLRNPWRYSFDRVKGDLWIGDVGQDAWEEVDLITAPDTGGQNYGWHCYEATHTYTPGDCNGSDGLTFPIYEYAHTNGSNGDCSIIGGYIYRGCKYMNLYGKYIFTDYCSGKFRAMEPDGSGGWTTTIVADASNSDYSSFGEDRKGELYIAGGTDGKIYKVTDTSQASQHIIEQAINSSATCVGNVLNTVADTGLNYQWSTGNYAIPGATDASYTPSASGDYSVQVSTNFGCANTSTSVYVSDYPVVSLSGLDTDYCAYQTSVLLTGDPAGGTFSGAGVNGNVFAPSIAGMGSHWIYYSYTNQYGCAAVDSQSVMVNECTGLNNSWEQTGLNIFPNPGDGSLTILLKDTNDAVEEISVYNVAGQILFKLAPVQNYGAYASLHLDLTKLANGIYAMKIIQGGKVSMHKVVISR